MCNLDAALHHLYTRNGSGTFNKSDNNISINETDMCRNARTEQIHVKYMYYIYKLHMWVKNKGEKISFEHGSRNKHYMYMSNCKSTITCSAPLSFEKIPHVNITIILYFTVFICIYLKRSQVWQQNINTTFPPKLSYFLKYKGHHKTHVIVP